MPYIPQCIRTTTPPYFPQFMLKKRPGKELGSLKLHRPAAAYMQHPLWAQLSAPHLSFEDACSLLASSLGADFLQPAAPAARTRRRAVRSAAAHVPAGDAAASTPLPSPAAPPAAETLEQQQQQQQQAVASLQQPAAPTGGKPRAKGPLQDTKNVVGAGAGNAGNKRPRDLPACAGDAENASGQRPCKRPRGGSDGGAVQARAARAPEHLGGRGGARLGRLGQDGQDEQENNPQEPAAARSSHPLPGTAALQQGQAGGGAAPGSHHGGASPSGTAKQPVRIRIDASGAPPFQYKGTYRCVARLRCGLLCSRAFPLLPRGIKP